MQTCETCRFWNETVVRTNRWGGELEKEARHLTRGCTRFPKWEETEHYHYCGEHQPRDEKEGQP